MEVDDGMDVKSPSLQRKSSAKKASSVKRRIVDDDDNSMSEDDLVKREDDSKPVKIEDEGLGKSLKSIDMSDIFSAQGSDDEQKPIEEDEKPASKPKRLTKLLPDATAEARKVFREISDSIYAVKDLGMNPFREDANMVCECTYDPATSPREDACGEDCVNRQIFMECTPGECRCGAYCMNRRFQRKEYADVQVIKTENKGFGLQTRDTLSKGAFIYEYIGEVINEPTFVERMQKYSDQGIKHFYFMMLQAGEFIDATIKGGLGRFVNHSCNPNCEVGKWVVGKHFRMGIFSKRKIQRGEELTFNYNVDRYGADAQKCYCGEPNCSGYIGGNTQTQLDTLPEMGLEALGFDATSMANARRKKPKKGDVVLPDPTPMRDDKDVARVVTAIRSFKDEREIIKRLLSRIRMTDAANLQRQVMRLHGFSVLAVVLQDLKDDAEIVSSALDVLLNLPLLKRNKIEDSKIETPVRELHEQCEHEEIRNMAKTLLEHWQTLEMSYRIPKKQMQMALEAQGIEVEKENAKKRRSPEEPSNGRQSPDKKAKVSPSTPVGNGVRYERAPASEDRATWSGWRRSSRSPPRRPPPRRSPPRQLQPNSPIVDDNALTKEKMQKIIEEAQRKAAETQAAKEAAEREEREAREKEERAREAFKKQKLKSKLSKSSLKSDERSHSEQSQPQSQSQVQSQSKPKILTDEEREKKLTKLVSDVVIKSMSHFKDQMEREQFKKRAKELTHVLVAKEQKSQSNSIKIADFSDDKKAKMKKFIKEYMNKLIKRIKEKQGKSNGKSGSPVTPDTPMKEAIGTSDGVHNDSVEME